MRGDVRVDAAFLEQRRRLALKCALVALVLPFIVWPLGAAMGGSHTGETIGGALFWVGIIALIAAPWIVRAWQGFMRRQMVAAAVANRLDIRHVDGARDRARCEAALSSAAFELAAFQDSGLLEPFTTANVQHVLTGDAQDVPFAMGEVALTNDRGFRVFDGVLASFQLTRPRPGLTIVLRDHGVLGNLLASAGSGVERLSLEDPDFEDVFEIYGDDQVMGRVVLTTTMLERLKALDELAHARGFACAFRGQHLMVAFSGMSWKCPAWRILRPLAAWLARYSTWLVGLLELPRGIVKTLNLVPPPEDAPAYVPEKLPRVSIQAGAPHVMTGSLFRMIGEGGIPVVYIMSGTLFGGLALYSAKYGMTEGFSDQFFWHLWSLIAAGIIYGIGAIGFGLRQLAGLAWRWNAPLRALRRH